MEEREVMAINFIELIFENVYSDPISICNSRRIIKRNVLVHTKVKPKKPNKAEKF